MPLKIEYLKKGGQVLGTITSGYSAARPQFAIRVVASSVIRMPDSKRPETPLRGWSRPTLRMAVCSSGRNDSADPWSTSRWDSEKCITIAWMHHDV